MNIEEIDKWLDNEYGVSYTRLEELHDFVVEQDLKHREEKDKEIDRLNNIINELEKYIHNELVLDFYNDDMPCELIINKMEKMIKELKENK